MKKYVIAIFLMLVGSLSRGGLPPGLVLAAVPAGDLAIIELKMTGSEMVVIENISSGTINLQNYLLEYFNKAIPSSLAVSTSTQSLPDFSLAAHQSFLLAGDSAPTCGAAGVANLSMSLSDSGGYIQLVKVSQPDTSGSITYTPQDHVNWTSALAQPAPAVNPDLTKVTTSPANTNTVWYRKIADGSWQQAQQSNNCSLFLLATSVTPAGSPTYIQWAEGSAPPVTIISLSDGTQTGTADGTLPPADVGLAAPQINELLPNPAEPQTDSEDEFIELYNSNDTAFDLTGFKLQTGTTSLHNYGFPGGTTLAPKSFTVFYSIDTNLSLSNTSGQVRLLDPAGNVISKSDIYESALDGRSWALANGTWYWTLTPTAGSANVINQPLTAKSLTTNPAGAGSVAAKKTTSSTAKTATAPKVKAATATTNNSSASSSPAKNPSPLHPLVLAGVGIGALGYAAYEYRHDLANRLYQLRRYRATRAAAGQLSKKS